MNRCVHRNAFTLIELLVVISIVAVLVAVLLPSLARAKFRAQTVICTARIKQSTLAILAYTNDNKHLTPGLWGPAYDYGTWIAPLASYVGAVGVTQANYYYDPQLKVLHCNTFVRGGTYAPADEYYFCINWSLRTTWYYTATGTVDPANSDDHGRKIDSLGLRTFVLVDGGYSSDVLHVPFITGYGIQGDYVSYPTPLYPNHSGWGNSMSRIDGSAAFYYTQQQFVPVGTREGSPFMYQSAWVRPSWGFDTATPD